MAGFTFSGRHYVPRLLWKRGEQKALSQVAATTKSAMTPLIELESTPDKKTPATHVEASMKALDAAWGQDQPLFVDAHRVAGGVGLSIAAAGKLGIQAIPVVRTATPLGSVAQAKSVGGLAGVALRVTPADLALPPQPWSQVDSFLTAAKLTRRDVHLILDFEALAEQGAGIVLTIAWNAALSIGATPFRTFTVLASSFPKSLAALKGAASTYPRHEWSDWQRLHAGRATLLPSAAAFGDYGIQNPTPPPPYQPGMVVIPAGRYTLPGDWLIARGINPKKTLPSGQLKLIAQHIQAHAGFYGATHCAGCADIVRCAGGASGFGTNEVWRRLGMVHHMTVAAAQVAAQPWP